MILKVSNNNPNAIKNLSSHLKNYIDGNFIIVCIGTDKFIGDCLGPMVGSILSKLDLNIPIYGTIKEPIHALNLEYKMIDITKKHSNSKILAIDACVTEDSPIGEIQFRPYPVSPGKGVGKSLRKVGDFSIIAIVEKKSNISSFSQGGIRLSFIIELAEIIAYSIKSALQ